MCVNMPVPSVVSAEVATTVPLTTLARVIITVELATKSVPVTVMVLPAGTLPPVPAEVFTARNGTVRGAVAVTDVVVSVAVTV